MLPVMCLYLTPFSSNAFAITTNTSCHYREIKHNMDSYTKRIITLCLSDLRKLSQIKSRNEPPMSRLNYRKYTPQLRQKKRFLAHVYCPHKFRTPMCHYHIRFHSLPSPPLFPSFFGDRGTNGWRGMLSGHTYWTRERRAH